MITSTSRNLFGMLAVLSIGAVASADVVIDMPPPPPPETANVTPAPAANVEPVTVGDVALYRFAGTRRGPRNVLYAGNTYARSHRSYYGYLSPYYSRYIGPWYGGWSGGWYGPWCKPRHHDHECPDPTPGRGVTAVR